MPCHLFPANACTAFPARALPFVQAGTAGIAAARMIRTITTAAT
jgi:hypothetical protein